MFQKFSVLFEGTRAYKDETYFKKIRLNLSNIEFHSIVKINRL